ncbi:MAG: hypothetical protein JO192_09630, partial [Candidatus Eremiobacteraeota bacterium]|nr:hypothetical protein [Candidatus Eremiobacteraeota bacterium]
MRRYLAVALLVALIGQSSGSALAGTVGGPHPFRFDIGSVIAPLRAVVLGSQVYAQFTGQGDRYAAMHRAAPVFPHNDDRASRRDWRGHSPAVAPKIRIGILHRWPLPSMHDLETRHLDHLAMRPSMMHAGPVRIGGEVTQPGAFSVSPRMLAPRRGFMPMAAPTPIPIAAGAGINHWWTYEERAIPGLGQALVNVGTGNMIVSATDFDVPERGIDLAFRRVYNSQSLHDVTGDDGGGRAMYGNRWTNNFDAYMVYDQSQNTMTVYDIDGTPCRYIADGKGNWVPCGGVHATLEPTDATDCFYEWTKTNGTKYVFHSQPGLTNCTIEGAKRGQLLEIIGRNHNNKIDFNYSYCNGCGTNPNDVTEIDAVHSDGDEVRLVFGGVGGNNLLAKVVRPDGSPIYYYYDTTGNYLQEVDKPGNDGAATESELYDTFVNGSFVELEDACGPRGAAAVLNYRRSGAALTDGSCLLFNFDNSYRLLYWKVYGVINFTPNDSLSVPLNAEYQGWTNWYTETFSYGNPPAQCGASSGSGCTDASDTDGHHTDWEVDAKSRVVQTSEWRNSSVYLVTNNVWDATGLSDYANDLIATMDANGHETDYAYDQYGDTVEVAFPQVNVNGGAGARPIATYSYDAVAAADGNTYTNLTAYCDPVFNTGLTWTASTSNHQTPTQCPGSQGGTGYAHFLYDYSDSVEPAGRMTKITDAAGYARTIAYDSNDYGLPVTVAATVAFPQPNGQSRQPTQTFGYNANGLLISYDAGRGPWTLHYDAMNRLDRRVDPDGGL